MTIRYTGGRIKRLEDPRLLRGRYIYPLTAALEPLGSASIPPGPHRTPVYEHGSADAPEPSIGHLETPAPQVPGGVKGKGEGGAIGAPAAIANAVADAVRPLGVTITALPIATERLARGHA